MKLKYLYCCGIDRTQQIPDDIKPELIWKSWRRKTSQIGVDEDLINDKINLKWRFGHVYICEP
jgi:hypothetical protein